MAEAVKVAVRVRPFNQRENDYKTSLVIDMQGMIRFFNRVEPPGIVHGKVQRGNFRQKSEKILNMYVFVKITLR